MQRVSETVASVIDPRSAPLTASAERESRQVPEMRIEGVGLAARAEAREDEHHRSPQVARVQGGWVVTWGDRDHARAFFARMDEAGSPLGAPVVVRESRSSEEDVWSPAVVPAGRGFGMAWVDPANGRVRFVRLDAEGHPTGRATIVHDGLEMPMSARVAYNGSEFGIAVAMHAGVYFARVNAQGERVGDGVVVAEGTRVAALEELTAGPHGFALAWRDADEGHAHHRVRIGRDGQVLQYTAARGGMGGTRLARR